MTVLVVVAVVAACSAAVLQARHRVELHSDRLVVGASWAGAFAVPFDHVRGWAVLSRARAGDARLSGGVRVRCLPWRPAVLWLDVSDPGSEVGHALLVGITDGPAWRARLARRLPLAEVADPVTPSAAGTPSVDVDPWAPASGAAGWLLLGVAGVFGAVIPLLAIAATSTWPGGLAIAGGVAGLVGGALVVSQAAARTTASVLLGAVVAGLAAGLAPPAAALAGGVPVATAVLLAVATVPLAFAVATLAHR